MSFPGRRTDFCPLMITLGCYSFSSSIVLRLSTNVAPGVVIAQRSPALLVGSSITETSGLNQPVSRSLFGARAKEVKLKK